MLQHPHAEKKCPQCFIIVFELWFKCIFRALFTTLNASNYSFYLALKKLLGDHKQVITSD